MAVVIVVDSGYLWEVLPLTIIVVTIASIVAIVLLKVVVTIIPQQRYQTLSIKWVHPILITTYPRSTTNIRCIIIIVFISRN